MIEEIEYQGKVLALVLRAGFKAEGVTFCTPRENPLQVGVLGHKRGARIKPHIHKNLPKTLTQLQEVLHIECGRVEVEFYDDAGRKINSVTLGCGDTILLLSGGHGFSILEDCKIIEVKQGPYQGVEADKELLKTGEDTDEIV